MPLVKPLPPSLMRPTTLWGEVCCNYFKQVFVLLAVMHGYKEYEFTVEDYFTPMLECKFDTGQTVQVTVGDTNDVVITLMDAAGTSLASVRIRFKQFFGRNAISMSRLVAQRLSGYLA